MDSSFRILRVLCPAQYGDVLLCEETRDAHVTLVVVKEIAWAQVLDKQARHPRPDDKREDPTTASTSATNTSPMSTPRGDPVIVSPPPVLCDDPVRELDVAAKISAAGGHRHVVQYHKILRSWCAAPRESSHQDSGSCDPSEAWDQETLGDGTLGLVMEYCEDGDLLRRLDASPGNRLPEAEALGVLRQLVEGLRFLHEDIGVAHRDLSLENILVHRGVCKISDFGLSTPLGARDRIRKRPPGGDVDEASLDRVRDRVGKLVYMAPEVVDGRWYEPRRADIWSLGIIFFILLTGSPLIDLASRECRSFRAYCCLGLRRVLTDWRMLDDFRDTTVSLLEQMLSVEPEQRPTITSIACHPALVSAETYDHDQTSSGERAAGS